MNADSPDGGRVRRIDAATIRLLPGGVIRIEGRILSAKAARDFGRCISRFHERAMNLRAPVVVDVAPLSWISESAITVLVEWVLRVQHESPTRRYGVVFRVNPAVPWQRGTFGALLAVAPDVVSIQHAERG